MSDEIKYPWQQSVLDAFLAPRDFLPPKVSIAERAIAARLTDPQQTDLTERIALNDAQSFTRGSKAAARAAGRPETRRYRLAPASSPLSFAQHGHRAAQIFSARVRGLLVDGASA